MTSETRKQKIKRMYEDNQKGLDKVSLSIILALPPILFFLYDKFDKENSLGRYLYLGAIGTSFIILILFLFGFVFAKWGCNLDDFAHSEQCKNKKLKQKVANGCFRIADISEKIYLFGIVLVLVFLFALFYVNLNTEKEKNLPGYSAQENLKNSTSTENYLVKINIIEKEKNNVTK